MRLVIAVVALAACEPSTVVSGGDDEPYHPPYTQTLPDGPCAVENVSGTIPGVTLSIRADSCVYTRGTQAMFRYEVTTAAATAITVPDSGGGCGDCSGHNADPASFTRWVIAGTSAGGEDQQYCICDVGCCAPTQIQTVTVDATRSVETIQWMGRTWQGPSDTNNEMGGYFLPGRYTVDVTFQGYAQGMVHAQLPIEIVD
ncbi:MAG: hypothetical protein HOV81_07270 [Kofleriaceae bacterium]|nr:hypothetical protein [Kofleriaceae bacterium]